MRKVNPKFRWHISAKEKAEIRRLTLAGTRQSIIARTLGITAPSIGKTQRSMGLPTHLIVPEDQIMELFRKGWGGLRISKFLHVPANQVYAVAHRNKFRRADGVGYPEPHGDVAGFIEAVKARRGYVTELREQFGLGVLQAAKLAKQILGTVRFRRGRSKPPLSSDFPQKPRKAVQA